MKPGLECLLCIQNRVINLLISEKRIPKEKALKIAKEIMKFLIEEFSFNTPTTVIGTKRELLLKELLGEKDPYKEIKERSNEISWKIWDSIKDQYGESLDYDTFRSYVYLVAAANAMEWFLAEYSIDAREFLDTIANIEKFIAVDDSKELWEDIREGKNVLYMLDNAGEAVFDLQFIRYLKSLDKNITVAARGIPLINDITVDEARKLGFEKYSKVVSGGNYVGFYIDENTPKEFLDALNNADVIILKGMGNYEGVIEHKLNRAVYVILKVKCSPVSRSIGVEKGKLVIKRLEL